MVLRGILSLNVRLTKIRMLTKFSHGTGAINVLVLEILPYDFLFTYSQIAQKSVLFNGDLGERRLDLLHRISNCDIKSIASRHL